MMQPLTGQQALVTVDGPKLPAVNKTITDAYAHFDTALGSLDVTLERATNKIGDKSHDGFRFLTAFGLTAAVVGSTAAVAIGIGDWGFTTFVAGVIASAASHHTFHGVRESKLAKAPIASDAVAKLRSIEEDAPKGSPEAIALADMSKEWIAKIERGKVHGIEARSVLDTLAVRKNGATPEAKAQSERWLAIRAAAKAVTAEASYYNNQYDEFKKVFVTLTLEERAAIAPVLIAQIFDGELPRTKMPFAHAANTYALLRRAAENLDEAGKPLVADPVNEEEPTPAATPVEEAPATPNLPVASVATNVATLEKLLGDFDALLNSVLDDSQGWFKKNVLVSAEKVGRVFAMADDPARTSVERAFLGKRLERFLGELDAAQMYGYDVRTQIREVIASATSVDARVLESAVTLEAYFAATAAGPKAKLDQQDVQRILRSIDALAPEQRQSAAKRALDRYFENEKIRGGTPYDAAIKLGTGLLKLV